MSLRVGVTTVAALPDVDTALWSSGVTQNVVFLALLLQRLAEVSLVALVACPDGAAGHPLAERFGLAAMNEIEAAERLDVIIELGARGSTAAMWRFRKRGGRLVSYVAGNVMAMNFEAVACGVPHGELISESGFDAVWITPQHWRMNRSYAALTRCPKVEPAPHIWSPMLLEQSAARFGAPLFWKRDASGRPARVGVFDPNVNVLKTFHLPLLVCEEAFRRRPEAIDRVLLFSTDHLKGAAHFEEFCATTDLARAGRLFAEQRFPLAQMLGTHVDAVVTHQWENGLNYLYWDVLHAGYPLVHNAPEIAELGYYYAAFDPQDGGRALIEALERHAETTAERRPQVMESLWRLHIDNPTVQARHAELLASAMA
ncbi:MAG TPA: DUF2827 family protein [Caulobacteraceae bacterium]